jgi:hypothetical protein
MSSTFSKAQLKSWKRQRDQELAGWQTAPP